MSKQINPQLLTRRIAAEFPQINAATVLRDQIIVVSAPRSGSTLLFEQLARCADFWTIGGESHGVFRAFPHLTAENSAFDSGCLGRSHADSATQNLFQHCFLYLLRNRQGESYLGLTNERRPAEICLLEKTPRNALNIPFLLELFPNAKFVYLYRDPRQTVASLVEAWTLGLQTGRFITFPRLPNWDRSGWCFVLPSGWRNMLGKSIAEIAAFQWEACNRKIITDLKALPANRWQSIDYQTFIDEPQNALAAICEFAAIKCDNAPANDGQMPFSRTTITPPNRDKWRRFETEIQPSLPRLTKTFQDIRDFCAGI